MLYFRERELELRAAVRAPSWSEMRALPGVTNLVVFQGSRHSRIGAIMNLRRLSSGVLAGRNGLLGKAAATETRRRLVVTALALERYQRRTGNYPATLEALTPDLLTRVPEDFMSGRPLHYDRRPGARFVLTSEGTDFMQHQIAFTAPGALGFGNVPLLWPRAATTDEIQSYEQKRELQK